MIEKAGRRSLWIVGGEQRLSSYPLKEWHQYKKAVVVRVTEGKAERVLEYESPPEHCPSVLPSHVFKAGTIEDGKAYLCTNTEVLICDFPDFRVARVISLPFFNDLHHVALSRSNTLYVVVTGLDAVAELSMAGDLIRLIDVVDGMPKKLAQEVDYRKVATTKPHAAHPNYVFFVDGEPWVTRFEQRDAIPLAGRGRANLRIPLGSHGVHDGHVHGTVVRFTSVDGCIVSFDFGTGRKSILDLNHLSRGDNQGQPLGWCRGLCVRDSAAWVGFSRIRYTRLRKNLSWIRHGLRTVDHHRRPPTRVALYDLGQKRLVEELDLEQCGMDAIFSIHCGGFAQ